MLFSCLQYRIDHPQGLTAITISDCIFWSEFSALDIYSGHKSVYISHHMPPLTGPHGTASTSAICALYSWSWSLLCVFRNCMTPVSVHSVSTALLHRQTGKYPHLRGDPGKNIPSDPQYLQYVFCMDDFLTFLTQPVFYFCKFFVQLHDLLCSPTVTAPSQLRLISNPTKPFSRNIESLRSSAYTFSGRYGMP